MMEEMAQRRLLCQTESRRGSAGSIVGGSASI